MALTEVLSIRSVERVTDSGGLQSGFRVSFLTEATSGTHSFFIPDDEFSPDVARQRAESRAEEIDAAVSG